MDILSYELGAKSGGGGGGSYTAGTNINIDSNNTINCTVPYAAGYNGSMSLGANSSAGSSNSGCTVIGDGAQSQSYQTVAIGKGAIAYQNSIAIGWGAETYYTNKNSIAIGFKAANTKSNQALFGSSNAPINEATIYTSSGAKVLATEDYVTNAISSAITSALGGNY